MVCMEGSASGTRAPASTASRARPFPLRIFQAVSLACSPKFQVETTSGFTCLAAGLASAFLSTAKIPLPRAASLRKWRLLCICDGVCPPSKEGILFLHLPHQGAGAEDGG